MLDLLGADYTFLNERLAEHYGVDGVFGDAFRRVAVQDPNRRGLLGHGSILFQTSVETRTSPVFRGKWILTNFFNSPPPPPPADVPALEASIADSTPHSVRERLEQHRKDPVCAGCHAIIDPTGLALENFDAIGRWRDTDAGQPVDANATLPGGIADLGPERLARSAAQPPRALRVDVHGEAHGVRARAPPRGRGHADRAPHRARSRERRLPVQCPRARHRAQHAVSAEGPLRRGRNADGRGRVAGRGLEESN